MSRTESNKRRRRKGKRKAAKLPQRDRAFYLARAENRKLDRWRKHTRFQIGSGEWRKDAQELIKAIEETVLSRWIQLGRGVSVERPFPSLQELST